MYCKECNKKIPENSEFCPYCGKKVKKKKTNLLKIIAILCLSSVVIAIIVRLLFYKSGEIGNSIAQENDIIQEVPESDSLTSQIIGVEAIDSGGNNKILNLYESEFTHVLKSDLNTITNEYLVDITMKDFLINALYNKNENTYAFIHYMIYYTNSQNQDCYLCVARTGEDYLLPYNAVSNNGSTILVPDNVLNSILIFANKMNNHEYNENYYAISISENKNSNVYNVINKSLEKQSDNKSESSIETSDDKNKKEVYDISGDFKSYLSDEIWIRENLYIKESYFGDVIDINQKQMVKYTEIKDANTNMCIVITDYEGDGNCSQCSIVTFKNGKIQVKKLEDSYGSDKGRNTYIVNKDTNSVAIFYAGAGGARYDIYLISNNDIEPVSLIEMYDEATENGLIYKYSLNGESCSKQKYEEIEQKYIGDYFSQDSIFTTIEF